MKTLLITLLLLGISATQAMGGQLIFLRSDTSVFSFKPDGSLCLKRPPVRESSANPVTAHGLAIAKDSANKLWTDSDQVNISGNVINVSPELGLVFHNDSTGDSVLLTNAGNLEANTSVEANLTRVDMYLDNHVIETDIENNQTKEYCGFGDGRIEYDSSGATERFYLKDHLGSTRAVIDGNGTLVEVVSYDAYGAIIRSEIIAGVEEPTKEKFTGKEYDTSGFVAGMIACGMQLDYFGARYYDAEIGVWISKDKANQDWDSYEYCTDNPIIVVDKDGNLWFLVGAAIGAVVNVATHTGNIHNAGQFFGYLGVGAVSGAAASFGPVGIVAGGAFAGASNAALEGGKGRDIVIGGIVGGVAAYAGSVASSAVSPLLSQFTVNIGGYSSPIIQGAFQGAVSGAVGGAAGGFVGGFASGLITSDGNLNSAFQTGLNGAQSGAIIGGIAGGAINGIASGKAAYDQGQNPFLQGTTSLYRAIQPAEVQDIEAERQIRNLGQTHGKYFTTSAEDASSYAKQAYYGLHDPEYYLLKINSNFKLDPSWAAPYGVDGGIPAYVIPNSYLPQINNYQIEPSMSIPKK